MRRLVLVALSIIASTFLTGCEKEDPIPEERDPIYKDLQKKESDYKKAYEENKAKIAEAMEKLEKIEPHSIEKKEVLRDLANFRRLALEGQQLSQYYRIRAERRKYVDRIEYKNAFRAKKEWPNPSDYSDYLKNNHLAQAPRNWNARVPKLQSRLASSGKGAEKPKEHGKKSGH